MKVESLDEILERKYSEVLSRAGYPPERIVQEIVMKLLDDEKAASTIAEYQELFDFIRQRLKANDMPLTTLMGLRKMYGEPKESAEQQIEKLLEGMLNNFGKNNS